MGYPKTLYSDHLEHCAGEPVEAVAKVNEKLSARRAPLWQWCLGSIVPLVLLAGGRAKRGEPAAWLATLKQKAAAVVLFGEAAPTFAELLGANGYSGRIEQRDHLDQALPLASTMAAQLGARAVLLSPACASFDQFRDFEVRGDHFRQLVEGLE